MTTDIKDCPFCGSAANVQNDFGRVYWVQCENLTCGSTDGTEHAIPSDAIANWNRRPDSVAAPSVANGESIWELPPLTMAVYGTTTMLELEKQRRAAIAALPKPVVAMTEPFHHYGMSAEQVQQLLDGSLKPEEISGAEDVQHDRVRELVWWFARLTQGNANSKWAVRHACELAYFIATNGINRHIDLKAVRDAAFKEGVNITPQERGTLERIGFATPQPAAVGPDAALVEALKKIAAWDLPSTGKLWPSGGVVSYTAEYGTHGARDYIISVAADALAAHAGQGAKT